MTYRLTLIASALLLSAATAHARPSPTSTDDARAMAGRTRPAAETARGAVPAAPVNSTDEARTLAGRWLPAASPQAVTGPVVVTSTDQARALAGTIRVAGPAEVRPGVMASALPCGCKRG